MESTGERIENDGCTIAWVFGAINRGEGGARLDQLLAWYAEQKDLDSRDKNLCWPAIAQARITRLWRIGQLDVEHELKHSISLARQTAVAFLATAHAFAPRIRAMMDDSSLFVRIEAYRGVVELRDRDAGPKLEAIIARIPPRLASERSDSVRLDAMSPREEA